MNRYQWTLIVIRRSSTASRGHQKAARTLRTWTVRVTPLPIGVAWAELATVFEAFGPLRDPFYRLPVRERFGSSI